MATHGRGRSVALVGSVANEVVARGHDPLILAGPLVGDRPLGADVVTCVDETPASAALVPIGLAWARRLREPLTVLTVAEPVPPPLDDRPERRRFGPDGDVEAFLEAMVAPVRSEADDVPLRTVPVYDPISPAAPAGRAMTTMTASVGEGGQGRGPPDGRGPGTRVEGLAGPGPRRRRLRARRRPPRGEGQSFCARTSTRDMLGRPLSHGRPCRASCLGMSPARWARRPRLSGNTSNTP
jgi:hypothetical protein